jgi:ABC-2 type transport system ATP-binding protein
MTGLAVCARGLRKSFGARAVLDGLDLDVRYGETVVLLGPNGAGKTTTLEIVEGLREPDGGEVRLLGGDPRRRGTDVRHRVGFMLQASGVEPWLTVAECLELYGGYYPAPLPAVQVLDLVGLAPHAARPVRKLSEGQRRRLDLALALAGDPELLLLDEPTVGFDPVARRRTWETLLRLRAQGRTTLLATNDLAEATAVADRVVVVLDGRVAGTGTVPELVGSGEGRSLEDAYVRLVTGMARAV